MFPGVQFITGLIPTIYTMFLESYNNPTKAMGICTLLFGSIQGILYPICYLLNTGVFTVFGCCKKQKELNEEIEIRETLFFDKNENDF